jgi:hypothetical protein
MRRGFLPSSRENVPTTAGAMTLRRDQKPGRFMTSVLAIALAASTFAIPASAATIGTPACCMHMGATCPLIVLTCCRTDRPSPTSQAPLPQAPAAPVPDLVPVPASPPPVFDSAAIVLERIGRLGTPPPLYLLHSTLLV